ncbi:hypothetical protein FRX31_006130 [Thalictrum thalictroides]|uniref:Uncharacterized protein n=1 Tax=Thalictrum thalictroides TaxID=46969 RepID=A0A7J6X617_THATH|nr:hypothetical protein FRX31_006130 [Thalictrum thalictroides]
MAILSCLAVFIIAMFTYSVPSLDELQMFHKADIQLYKRIVGPLRQPKMVAKMVMALWFCLEELGYFDLLENIRLCDDKTLKLLINEATSCLEFMAPLPTPPGDDEQDLLMSALVTEPINQRFIYFNRRFISKRTNHFFLNVCELIFDDNPPIIVENQQAIPRRNCDEARTSTQNQQGSRARTSTQNQQGSRASSSSLNPLARPYCVSEILPPEHRTMFLTFSHGYPIPWEDIVEFFERKWGDIVEDLIMEETKENVEPKYARLVFRNVQYLLMILNGQDVVKFNVKGKHLRGRLFIPKRPAN